MQKEIERESVCVRERKKEREKERERKSVKACEGERQRET
jgi:hypothetical protein